MSADRRRPRAPSKGKSSKGKTPRSGAPARPATGDPAVVANGWTLLRWMEFTTRWNALVAEVEALRAKDPSGYRAHPTTRFLALLRKVVMQDVPADPGHDRYRLGKTMGADYKFWRRAKFGGRFRLFFRYRGGETPMIVYAWLNDEHTLRKAGGRTDVYTVFKAMLERGRPPANWEALVRASAEWRGSEAGTPPLGDDRDAG